MSYNHSTMMTKMIRFIFLVTNILRRLVWSYSPISSVTTHYLTSRHRHKPRTALTNTHPELSPACNTVPPQTLPPPHCLSHFDPLSQGYGEQARPPTTHSRTPLLARPAGKMPTIDVVEEAGGGDSDYPGMEPCTATGSRRSVCGDGGRGWTGD